MRGVNRRVNKILSHKLASSTEKGKINLEKLMGLEFYQNKNSDWLNIMRQFSIKL